MANFSFSRFPGEYGSKDATIDASDDQALDLLDAWPKEGTKRTP